MTAGRSLVIGVQIVVPKFVGHAAAGLARAERIALPNAAAAAAAAGRCALPCSRLLAHWEGAVAWRGRHRRRRRRRRRAPSRAAKLVVWGDAVIDAGGPCPIHTVHHAAAGALQPAEAVRFVAGLAVWPWLLFTADVAQALHRAAQCRAAAHSRAAGQQACG